MTGRIHFFLNRIKNVTNRKRYPLGLVRIKHFVLFTFKHTGFINESNSSKDFKVTNFEQHSNGRRNFGDFFNRSTFLKFREKLHLHAVCVFRNVKNFP